MRVMVTGSRYVVDFHKVWKTLDRVYASLKEDETLTVLVGDCPTGADKFASEWNGGPKHTDTKVFKADWKKYGRSAGPTRNQAIVDDGDIDLCLAFLQEGALNRGTNDCIERARKARIPVVKEWCGQND